MEKTYIEFSNNGTEAVFKFPNGNESIPFYGKDELLKALDDLKNKEKISLDNFVEMRETVWGEKRMPKVAPEQSDSRIKMISIKVRFKKTT